MTIMVTRPPDYLPGDVLERPDFIAACKKRDLGEMLAIANKRGGAGFTVSHIARRCEMTVSQVQDYIKRGRRALSMDIFERVADGLHISGRMLGKGG
jgi:AcrR family transcriptional regulator